MNDNARLLSEEKTNRYEPPAIIYEGYMSVRGGILGSTVPPPIPSPTPRNDDPAENFDDF
jgi:hypothetical protein